MNEWNTLGERMTRIEKEIQRRIVPFERAVTLWQSIPGIEWLTACNRVAEIGVNMDQFPSAQHLASWAGLCPGNHESAGKRMSGKTRTATQVVAACALSSRLGGTRKKDCYLSAQFRRLAARRGMKRAVMAVAHRMLVIAYTMLKTDRPDHELGGTYLEQINKDQLQRYFVKRLQRLGFTVTVQPAA